MVQVAAAVVQGIEDVHCLILAAISCDNVVQAVVIQINNRDGVTSRQVQCDRMFPETYGSLTPDKGYEQKKPSNSYKKTS